jgi:hypothetical protein
MTVLPNSPKSKHKYRAGLVVAVCVLIPFLVVAVNFIVFSLNQPSYDDLALEAGSTARAAGVNEEPVKYDHPGAVLQGSKPEARVSASKTGRREDVYSQLAQLVEQRGYSYVESVDDRNFLSGTWRKDKIEISIFVRGVPDQVQSLDVNISATPSR